MGERNESLGLKEKLEGKLNDGASRAFTRGGQLVELLLDLDRQHDVHGHLWVRFV